MFLSVCIIFLPAYALVWRAGRWIDKIISGGYRPRQTTDPGGGQKPAVIDATLSPHPVDIFLSNKTVVSAVDKIINHFLGSSDDNAAVVPRAHLQA